MNDWIFSVKKCRPAVCILNFLHLRHPCGLEVVLVFPGPGAVSVRDMMQRLSERTDRQQRHACYEPRVKRLKCDDVGGAADTAEESKSEAFPLHRVVFIDSTWNQTSKISTDERLQGNHGLTLQFKLQEIVNGRLSCLV